MTRFARALALSLWGGAAFACQGSSTGSGGESSANDDGGTDTGSSDAGNAVAEDGAVNEDAAVSEDAGLAVPPGTLAFETDDAALVEGMIHATSGGTITATGDDGAVYKLTVPPYAVASDVMVTLTPLKQIAGIGEGSSVYAVQLAPDGLRFQFLARLQITPPSSVPVKRELSFFAQTGGEALGSALVDLEAVNNTILVERFAVYGLGNVSDAEREAFLAEDASDPFIHLQHRVGEVLAVKRRNTYLGTNEALPDLSADFEAAWTGPIADLRAVHSTSCDAEAELLEALLSDARLQILSEGSVDGNVLNGLIQSRASVEGECKESALKVCRASRDPAYLLEYYVRTERASALLAATTPSIDAGQGERLSALVSQAAEDCTVVGYTASGGNADITMGGAIDDPSYTFALTATYAGETFYVAYTPSSSNVSTGTYTYAATLTAGQVTGSGDYTLSAESDGSYVLTQEGEACLDQSCAASTATIQLTITR